MISNLQTITNKEFDKYELITGITKPLALKIVLKNIPKEILTDYIINFCNNDNIYKVLNACFENYELQQFIFNSKNISDNYLLKIYNNELEEGNTDLRQIKFNRMKFCTKLQKNKSLLIFKEKITHEEVKNFIIESTSNEKFEKIFEKIFTTSKLKSILMIQPLNEEDYDLLLQNLRNNKNSVNLKEHTILDDDFTDEDNEISITLAEETTEKPLREKKINKTIKKSKK